MASSKLITKEGTTEPKAVLSLYEDFLCPHCGEFEQKFGPTINQLIDSGAIAADYYMVAILDSPANAELLVARGRCRLLRRRRDTIPTRRRSVASTPRCTPSSRGETGTSFPTTRG